MFPNFTLILVNIPPLFPLIVFDECVVIFLTAVGLSEMTFSSLLDSFLYFFRNKISFHSFFIIFLHYFEEMLLFCLLL